MPGAEATKAAVTVPAVAKAVVGLVLVVKGMSLTLLPGPLQTPGASRINEKHELRGVGRAIFLLVLLCHEIDLVHFPLRVLIAQVAVMLDHLAVGVAEPLLDLSFRCTPQEGLTAEVMAETVKPAVLKTDLVGRRGELLFERLDHIANEGVQHVAGAEHAAALGVEHAPVRLP